MCRGGGVEGRWRDKPRPEAPWRLGKKKWAGRSWLVVVVGWRAPRPGRAWCGWCLDEQRKFASHRGARLAPAFPAYALPLALESGDMANSAARCPDFTFSPGRRPPPPGPLRRPRPRRGEPKSVRPHARHPNVMNPRDGANARMHDCAFAPRHAATNPRARKSPPEGGLFRRAQRVLRRTTRGSSSDLGRPRSRRRR